jgi:hypothetical protein
MARRGDEASCENCAITEEITPYRLNELQGSASMILISRGKFSSNMEGGRKRE